MEYKKAESQTNIEITDEADWAEILKIEEEWVLSICKSIIAVKPDLVFTEKGVSDLAQHFLAQAGISVIRRLRKTDNNRIARATGAVICHEPAELTEEHVGKKCGLFEVRKLGDEYFTFLDDCRDPKACTIMLRGGSKDSLNEIERNLQDAMNVVRNIVFDPRVMPGGGATEMAIGQALVAQSKTMDGVSQWPFRAVAEALEVIPRTLVENCGGSVIRLLTELRGKHAAMAGQKCTWGIDGNKGEIADMADLKIYEPFLVKTQTIKTAIESAMMLLRIDDIVSGLTPGSGGQGPANAQDDDGETFGDSRDG